MVKKKKNTNFLIVMNTINHQAVSRDFLQWTVDLKKMAT